MNLEPGFIFNTQTGIPVPYFGTKSERMQGPGRGQQEKIRMYKPPLLPLPRITKTKEGDYEVETDKMAESRLVLTNQNDVR